MVQYGMIECFKKAGTELPEAFLYVLKTRDSLITETIPSASGIEVLTATWDAWIMQSAGGLGGGSSSSSFIIST
jgi:hypothetical protein